MMDKENTEDTDEYGRYRYKDIDEYFSDINEGNPEW